METTFVELNEVELYSIDGGVNWDTLMCAVLAVGAVVGVLFPPVGFAVACVAAGYAVARAFGN